MTRSHRQRTGVIVGWLLVVGAGWAPAAPDAARMTPADAVVLVTAADMTELIARFKQTPLYALYEEPTLQPFIRDLRANLEAEMQEGLRDLERELEMNLSWDTLPWPQGQVGVALVLRQREIRRPSFDGNLPESQDPGVAVTELTPQMICWAELGDRAPLFMPLVEAGLKMEPDGRKTQRRERIRGVDFIIAEQVDDGEAFDEYYETTYEEALSDWCAFGLVDQRAVVCTDADLLRETLSLWDGGGAALADEPVFQEVRQQVGRADVEVFCNVALLRDMIVSELKVDAETAQDKQRIDQMVGALGLDGLGGAGVGWWVAPRAGVLLETRGFLETAPPVRGILAMLTRRTGPLTHPLLTQDVTSFSVMHYDLGEIYDWLLEVAMAAAGIDLSVMLEGALAMTGQPGPDGRPPVDLRADILGQLRAPIVFTQALRRPYVDGTTESLFAAGVRDAQRLDDALGRVHAVYVARGKPEMRRQLHGTRIYELPPAFGLLFGAGMDSLIEDGTSQQRPPAAMAVVGDRLVLGPVGSVEQAIRNLERDDAPPITANAMFRHARRFLPAAAGLATYENQQEQMAQVWTVLTAAATQRRAALGGSGHGPRAGEQIDVDLSVGPATTPADMMVQVLGEYCDFSLLPDFETVRHYFGASVSWLIPTQRGVEFEAIVLDAPPDEDL